LKEQEAGGPNGCAAAEPGEDVLADDRLHLEEKKRTGEDRSGVIEGEQAIARGMIHPLIVA
jgi:hypothetical protein